MSDDDDWPSSEEDEDQKVAASVATSPSTDPPPPAAAAAAASTTSSTATAVETNAANQQQQQQQQQQQSSSPPSSSPVVILFSPVGLYLEANATSGTVAMQTLLYNAVNRDFVLYVYDQTKRPLIAEPITTVSNDTDALPLRVRRNDKVPETACTLVDRAERGWILQFQTATALQRFFSFMCLCGARLARGVKCLDLTMGQTSEKRWKSKKQGAMVDIQAWCVCDDPLEWAAFDSSTTTPTHTFTQKHILWEELPLSQMRPGGTRLVVADIRAPTMSCLQPWPDRPTSGFCVLQVTITSVSKKLAKRRTTPPVDDAPAATTTTVNDNQSELPTTTTADDDDDDGNNDDHVDNGMQLAVVDESMKPVTGGVLLEHLRDVNMSVGALPETQNKIFKHVLKQLYTSVTESVETVDADEETSIDSVKQRCVESAGSCIRAALTQFAATNEKLAPGTTHATVTAFDTLKHDVASLIGPDGELVMTAPAPVAAPPTPDSSQQTAAAMAEQSAALEKARDEIVTLGSKQMELATQLFEMEAQLESVKKENAQLRDKVAASHVFEGALLDMRKLLESEIEAKNTMEANLNDVLRLQQKFKLTWIPKSAVDHCLQCGAKFRMFGSKASEYCRYCGRLYCRECCKHRVQLPELGYKDEVPTCGTCFRIKNPRAAAAAANSGSDEEEA